MKNTLGFIGTRDRGIVGLPPASGVRRKESSAMQCKACGGTTSVIKTRPGFSGSRIRRRVCGACGIRFSTIEIRAEALQEMVQGLEEQVRKLQTVFSDDT